MKKSRVLVLFLFIMLGVSFAKAKINEQVKSMVQQCAKLSQPLLPSQVDELTILWGINGEDDKIVYYYALKYTSKDLDIDSFEKLLKPTLVATIKDSQDITINKLKENKVSFEHRYFGCDGQLISSLIVTPADYEN